MSLKYYQNKKLATSFNSKSNHYYLAPSDPLIAALNVALHLGMPLLLTGEPGTGKTKFAHHVAERFGLGEAFVFNAKTTSTAEDLYYRYDAIRHYHLTHHGHIDKDANLLDVNIILLEAMGLAIKKAQEKEQRSVVLIDEIDKAPRDFPNDLLNQLEAQEFSFSIPEWGGQSYKASTDLKPIVVITSNSEKNLPEPFLRRCVYYHIPFPEDGNTLLHIVKGQLSSAYFKEAELQKLINEFLDIRKLAKSEKVKKPATAELVAWLLLLQDQQFEVNDLANPDSAIIKASYTLLAKDSVFRKRLLDRLTTEQPT